MVTVAARRNIWGNINGFVGRERVVEFGPSEWLATEWLANHVASGNKISAKSDINLKQVQEHVARLK